MEQTRLVVARHSLEDHDPRQTWRTKRFSSFHPDCALFLPIPDTPWSPELVALDHLQLHPHHHRYSTTTVLTRSSLSSLITLRVDIVDSLECQRRTHIGDGHSIHSGNNTTTTSLTRTLICHLLTNQPTTTCSQCHLHYPSSSCALHNSIIPQTPVSVLQHTYVHSPSLTRATQTAWVTFVHSLHPL